MLDLGFEREMNQCLDLIKKKAAHRFNPAEISDETQDRETMLKT